MSAGECVACLGRWPAAACRVAELGVMVADLRDDRACPGPTAPVLPRHATELSPLLRDERAERLEDLRVRLGG